jgi:hypothetical protein
MNVSLHVNFWAVVVGMAVNNSQRLILGVKVPERHYWFKMLSGGYFVARACRLPFQLSLSSLVWSWSRVCACACLPLSLPPVAAGVARFPKNKDFIYIYPIVKARQGARQRQHLFFFLLPSSNSNTGTRWYRDRVRCLV